MQITTKKGKVMGNHRRNWQYAITKEVLAIHEVIDPYDWELDIDMNEDFQEWEKEISKK
jgi:hypothetical protein